MQKTETSNLRTFRTPFTPSYWKEAAGEVKKPRVLAVTALFIGLDIIIGMFYIPMPFGDNLRASVEYRRAIAPVLVRRAAEKILKGEGQA